MDPDSNCDRATLTMLMVFSTFSPWGACIAAAAYIAAAYAAQMIESQSDDGR